MKLFGSKSEVYEPLLGACELPLPTKSRLSCCVAAVSGLTLSAVSSLALGLGLGDLQARSYLGQPLTADIDLVSAEGGVDLDTLLVRQVPAAEALAMGVDVSYTSYQLDLKVDKSSGNPKVAIVSSRPIKEPYLNLLIELRWPSGVVYREYPLLLDPPPAIEAAAVASQEKPAESRSAPTLPPVGPRSAPARIELPPLRTVDGRYQVQPGDSLSRIAERWREGTSQGIEETMEWLHANNPKAFARGDINQLLAGAVLQMPDLSAYAITSGAEDSQARVSEQTATPTNRTVAAPVAPPTSGSVQSKVGRDAARVVDSGGLLTVGAADRDDKAREMIDLLVRENESLKERVEKLESSEYLDTLKQLIILQRQQIADLRSELGVRDGAAVAEMDGLLTQIGVDVATEPNKVESAVPEPRAQNSVEASLPAQTSTTSAERATSQTEDAGVVVVETPTQPVVVRADEDKSWFVWFVIGSGVLLAGLFAAMYAYYRKLVPVRSVEEEYAEILAPVDDEEETKKEPSFSFAGQQESDDFIHYDGAPQGVYKARKGQGKDDWMGEKASPIAADSTQLDSDLEEMQRSFEAISLDEDALSDLDRITETSLEAITREIPKESDELRLVKEGKSEPNRRPDEEVKMSIAEKMSQYNPDEYRQELENLGFLELDELVDLDDSDEDEVEAVIYRAMMFCEFKKFDKAIDLIESKAEVIDDERLAEALAQVHSLRRESGASSKSKQAS